MTYFCFGFAAHNKYSSFKWSLLNMQADLFSLQSTCCDAKKKRLTVGEMRSAMLSSKNIDGVYHGSSLPLSTKRAICWPWGHAFRPAMDLDKHSGCMTCGDVKCNKSSLDHRYGIPAWFASARNTALPDLFDCQFEDECAMLMNSQCGHRLA